jgi:hypothetical protein
MNPRTWPKPLLLALIYVASLVVTWLAIEAMFPR